MSKIDLKFELFKNSGGLAILICNCFFLNLELVNIIQWKNLFQKPKKKPLFIKELQEIQ